MGYRTLLLRWLEWKVPNVKAVTASEERHDFIFFMHHRTVAIKHLAKSAPAAALNISLFTCRINWGSWWINQEVNVKRKRAEILQLIVILESRVIYK